ncbi:hypothetical protein EYF80_000887 [Liparis tanakae]|uniref:Uncharacterized protein n=1 Tax=Liparis tanakae TaxID=230148 RepID=A0A4Z2JFH1_9TELE|nr:hypothetical protein EYF80_000887 [Liparis tanakae]
MLGPARYFRLRNRKYLNLLSGSDYATSYSASPRSQVTFYLLRYATRRDGVTCCCGEHRAGSQRDALPLIEEASRDQLGALEPEEPYMAREPDVKYLKGALQGKKPLPCKKFNVTKEDTEGLKNIKAEHRLALCREDERGRVSQGCFATLCKIKPRQVLEPEEGGES